jgi:hypothetical protein
LIGNDCEIVSDRPDHFNFFQVGGGDDGKILDCTRTQCMVRNIGFYRQNPENFEETFDLATHDDVELITMLWHTLEYLTSSTALHEIRSLRRKLIPNYVGHFPIQ